MATPSELSYHQIAKHANKNDLYIVIHNKVYDCTQFTEEHPGGVDVLLDMGGKDGTEAFEDIGHSDEARKILERLHVGNLKRQDSTPQQSVSRANTVSGGRGTVLCALVLIVVLAASGAYQYLQSQESRGEL